MTKENSQDLVLLIVNLRYFSVIQRALCCIETACEHVQIVKSFKFVIQDFIQALNKSASLARNMEEDLYFCKRSSQENCSIYRSKLHKIYMNQLLLK